MAVKIAYAVTNDPGIGEIIQMTGYDYYRQFKDFAHGSNRNLPGEPYNYYEELMDFMRKKGFPELMESMWELPEGKLSILKHKLMSAGYDPVEVAPPPAGQGPFEEFNHG